MPAAAKYSGARELLGGSFAFGSLGAALADDADHDRVFFAVLDQGNTSRQLDLRGVDVVADVQGAEVDFDELRQILGQAVNVQLGGDVVNQAAIQLDARAGFFVGEVQRHLDMQFVGGIDALEVDVQDQLLVGVRLVVAQQDLFLLAVDDQVDDGRVEGFLLHLQQQVVMVGFDGDRSGLTTINDTRHSAGATQAAARTRSLDAACRSDNFELHVATPKCFPIRD